MTCRGDIQLIGGKRMKVQGHYNEEQAVVIVEKPTDELELALYRELSVACLTAAVRICHVRGERAFLQLYVFQAAHTINSEVAGAWTKILLYMVIRACNSIGAEYSFQLEEKGRLAS
jgi:hypothetical protein